MNNLGKSKEALEEYLYDHVGSGLLNCKEITVHDVKAWIDEMDESESKKVINATYYSWFMYKCSVGPLITKASNFRLKQKNKRLQKERANK